MPFMRVAIPVANPDLGERVGQGVEQLVMTAAGHHDPGQRGAYLPGQEALGQGQGPRGGLDVRVVEDHRGGLAAEFQGAARSGRRRSTRSVGRRRSTR
jgi:hypothetical protein